MAPPGEDLARVLTGDHSVEIPVEKTVRIPALLRVFCSVEQNSAGIGECRSTQGPAVGPGVYITLPGYEGRQPFLVIDVQPPVPPTIIEVKMRVAPGEDAAALVKAGDLDLGASQNPFAAGASVTAPPTATNHLVTLKVPAFPTLLGWQYGGQMLRVGGSMTFYSTRYVLTGTVAMVPTLPAQPAKP